MTTPSAREVHEGWVLGRPSEAADRWRQIDSGEPSCYVCGWWNAVHRDGDDPEFRGLETVRRDGEWVLACARCAKGPAVCRHCGHGIHFSVYSGRWVHDEALSTGEFGNVGCRAASYDRNGGEGWDDSLDRSWKASPRR